MRGPFAWQEPGAHKKATVGKLGKVFPTAVCSDWKGFEPNLYHNRRNIDFGEVADRQNCLWSAQGQTPSVQGSSLSFEAGSKGVCLIYVSALFFV